MVVLDTNILVRSINRSDPQHQAVMDRLRRFLSDGEGLCIAPQSVYEFWAVATRPVAVNGLGLLPQQAREATGEILGAIVLFPDPADLLMRWLDLCEHRRVCGRQAHDARLAAWMISNGLQKLFTLNERDFARYPEIECLRLAE